MPFGMSVQKVGMSVLDKNQRSAGFLNQKRYIENGNEKSTNANRSEQKNKN
jgi:hypothetical protein